MINRLLKYLFYALFFLTPFIWLSKTYELFEFNKMIFVYLTTILSTGIWLFEILVLRRLSIKKTWLDFPLFLFLLANILSTIFSIEPHVSIWGYYSRSNGGLLSTLCYILLYYNLVSHFKKEDAIHFAKAAVLGGFLIALYAIPEHFGTSPSCVIINSKNLSDFSHPGIFTASCWVQDVKSRVFATLGQPNWLAAYLGMLIPIGTYFLLQAKRRFFQIIYLFITLALYTAFNFTYSRGATLGLLTGVAFLLTATAWIIWRDRQKASVKNPLSVVAVLLALFIITNLYFGSALTRFQGFSSFFQTRQQTSNNETPQNKAPGQTQLESGGTESGKIRLIVWKGAWQAFLHYPLFGSGAETFAYAYYQFRPPEHNLVSEWDFLYNKAHNEYLNYLATTGIFGFSAYILVITSFVTWSIIRILKTKGEKSNNLFLAAILASYITYLIQNIFSFSVVVIALFFFLFPSLSLIYSESVYDLNSFKLKQKKILIFFSRIFGFKLTQIVVSIVLSITTLTLCLSVVKIWVADTFFAEGTQYSEAGLVGRAFNTLQDAVRMRRSEPLYRSELGFASAAAAAGLADEDATESARLKEEAVAQTNYILNRHPKNISFFRTAIRTFYQLSALDPKFNDTTLQTLDKAIQLAPTDAKLYYNKGLILGQNNRIPESTASLQKAINLRPTYKEAYIASAEIFLQEGDKNKAKQYLEMVLKFAPDDQEATELMKKVDTK